MVFKSGPNTLIPIGALIPVWSITSRVSMGCNLGADVTPGILDALIISSHISSGDCILSLQFR